MDELLATSTKCPWFLSRMTKDHWYFGLTMKNGSTIPISDILRISLDEQWIDVQLIERENLNSLELEWPELKFFKSYPHERLIMSLRLSEVVLAFELRDT